MIPLPEILFGTYAEVAKRCRSLIPRLARGHSLSEVIEADKPKSKDWLIVTTGPSAALRSEANYQIYVLHAQIRAASLAGKFSAESEERIFRQSLEIPWGTVALNASRSQDWFINEERAIALIDATAQIWSEIQNLGAVFADRFPPGRPFTSVRSTLLPALKVSGLNDHQILPLKSLPSLLAEVRWQPGRGLPN